MFNPIRAIRVLGRFLLLVAPFLLLILGLGVFTELRVRHVSWASFSAAPQRALDFWPQIVRDMVPSLAAMFMAYWLAARFVRALYGLHRLGQGFSFLWRWRFGQVEFAPYLLIQEGRVAKDKDKVVTLLGGPGNLVIYNDSAVVLERAGQITRVERSSFAPLHAFERVYRVIDLRPKRKRYEVKAMTREGIPITCEADISYQIKRSPQEPTKELPFPVSAQEVLRAATCMWKCEPRISEGGELDWEGLIILAYTDGILRSILARYPLDQLIGPSGWEENEAHPRQTIREELEQRLRAAARELGAEILSVNLGDIVVRDEVTEQWIAAWEAQWGRRMAEPPPPTMPVAPAVEQQPVGLTLAEQHAYLERERSQYERNLAELLLQKAKYGLRVPTDLLNEIRDTKAEIERLAACRRNRFLLRNVPLCPIFWPEYGDSVPL